MSGNKLVQDGNEVAAANCATQWFRYSSFCRLSVWVQASPEEDGAVCIAKAEAALSFPLL